MADEMKLDWNDGSENRLEGGWWWWWWWAPWLANRVYFFLNDDFLKKNSQQARDAGKRDAAVDVVHEQGNEEMRDEGGCEDVRRRELRDCEKDETGKTRSI